MKRKIMRSVLCVLLVVAMLMAPMSALASSKVALILKVKNDWVRLREGTDSGGEVITRLRKGTKLLYWGENKDEMFKVLTASGKVGYVYKGYVSTYGALKKSSIYVTEEAIKLYKRSGSKLKSNGKLSKGKYVVVYKTSGKWAYIKTMSGKSAYCLKDSLKKAF